MFCSYADYTHNRRMKNNKQNTGGTIAAFIEFCKLIPAFLTFSGAVSDLLVTIPGLVRFNEVKSLNVRLRIRSVKKNVFLQIYKHSKIAVERPVSEQM